MANLGTLVVQGGTLIDGTGKPPVNNSVILIEGDRFKSINSPAAATECAEHQVCQKTSVPTASVRF